MIRVRFEPRGNTGDARHDRVAIVERVSHEHDPKAVHVVTFGPEEWSNLAAAVCRDHETIEATMRRRIDESNRASAKLLRDLAARLETGMPRALVSVCLHPRSALGAHPHDEGGWCNACGANLSSAEISEAAARTG